ncbi:MAG: internal scaffolding protein [Microvirus sp.]|nr:MAG: internal scaffolding protein [Microvirus sp.]
MTPTIYSRYNPPPQVKLACLDPSRTQQHFKEECDINNILAKFMETGLLPNVGPGSYEDLTAAGDYQEAMHTLMKADEAFANLPSHVRKTFQNDPGQFLEFIQDPNNKKMGQELGLFNPDPPQNLNQTTGQNSPAPLAKNENQTP